MFSKPIFDNHEEPFSGKNNNPLNDTSTDDGSNAAALSTNYSTVPLTGSSVDPPMHTNPSTEHNGFPSSSVDSDEIATLVAQVNDNLERKFKETKKGSQTYLQGNCCLS